MSVEGFPIFKKKTAVAVFRVNILGGKLKLIYSGLILLGGKGLHLEEISHVEC
jgi:hypothetical protein